MKFDNLKKFRESLNLKQEEFARPLGINKTTYSNYEVGARDPKSDFWILVAKTYHVDIDFLLGLTDTPRSSVDAASQLMLEEKEHIKKYRTLDEHGKDIVDTVLDKEYERVQAPAVPDAKVYEYEELFEYLEPVSAGTGARLDLLDAGKNIKVISNVYTKKADFVLRVTGHSMEPRFHDGDKLLVQEADEVEIGDIGVWIIEGESFVKKCAENYLSSLNPDYPPIYPGDVYSQRCIGHVVGVLDPEWVLEE